MGDLMLHPQEIEVWYVLPAIRKALAISLKNKGMPQIAIANLLGLSKSAVSQYLNKKRGGDLNFTKKIKKEIDDSAKHLIAGGSVLIEIDRICNIVKKTSLLCKLHRKHAKIPKDCSLCLK